MAAEVPVIHLVLGGWRTVCGLSSPGPEAPPLRVSTLVAKTTCEECRRRTSGEVTSAR